MPAAYPTRPNAARPRTTDDVRSQPTPAARFHIALHTRDLDRAEQFYRLLFGAPATAQFHGGARFELSEPPLTLLLHHSPQQPGGALNHCGLRLPDAAALVTVQRRLEEQGLATQRQEGVECCYALQTKFWVTDPDGILWEVYTVHEDIEHSGFDDPPPTAAPVPNSVWEHRLTDAWPERLPHADGALDEVRLEGSFNAAVQPNQLDALLGEVRRVLRPGGRLAVHALVGDVPFPGAPQLPGLAALVQYVPLEYEPLAALERAGFVSMHFEKLDQVHCFGVDGVALRELQLSAWKPETAKWPSACVVYKGPFAQVEDDLGTVLMRAEETTLPWSTAERLRLGAAAEQFAFLT